MREGKRRALQSSLIGFEALQCQSSTRIHEVRLRHQNDGPTRMAEDKKDRLT
jgi:hypothetical protein